MNVLIINQHSSNFGDDAAGTALVQMLLKQKEVDKINIIYNADQKIPLEHEKVQHCLDIRFRNVGYFSVLLYLILCPYGFVGFKETMKKWAKIINDADIVFVAPSGANIGIYKDWRFLIRVLMAVRADKKVIFHYNTIGASGNILFDAISKYVIKKSKLYVREKKSYEYIKSLGLKSTLGPDTAFALAPICETTDDKLISIVPSHFDDWHPNFQNNPVDDRILNKLIPEIARWLKVNQCRIQILPHLCLADEREFNTKILKKFQECGINDVVFRDDVDSMWKYDYEISRSRLVIGMRYHAVVLAAKNYRPFISLSYENKMKEVCSYLHSTDFDLDLIGFAKGKSLHLFKTLNKAYNKHNGIARNLKKVIVKEIIPKVTIPINDNMT